jgi:hypothetical protein
MLSTWGRSTGGAGPALDLNLALPTGGVLDPRITFSRTTNATVTGSNGLIQNAPMNLLTFSEQFDNSAWTKSGSTLTANVGVAPNGTVTADSLVETGASAQRFAYQASSSPAVNQFTASCYIQNLSGTRLWQLVVLQFGGGSAAGIAITSAGVYSNNVSLGSNLSVASYSITQVSGTNWYRVSVTVNAATAASCGMFVALSNSTAYAPTYTGDGTSGIYIWGAQLELGSTATTYNPTTVKNLLGYTENFDNAAWTKSNATVDATKVNDIYGQPFAQKITASAGNATILSSCTAVASTPYTFSVYLKRDTGTGNIDITADGTTWVTKTLTTEFQRFDVTASPTAGTKTPGIRIATSGDVVIAFGAQLSDSASVDPYVYNPVAAPTSTAYYGPRFDYDPVTLAPKGLLIEEQRTNLVLRSQAFTVSPWSSYLSTTVANAAVAPDGTTTATSMVVTGQYGNISQTVVVSASTTYTYSCYVRVPTGSTALIMQSFDGTSYTNVSLNVGSTWTRVTRTVTTGAAAVTLTLQIIDNSASGWVGVQIWGAQLEAGAFATSYIPTVASQVTRAADNASMIGNNFARWYTQGVGTIFSQFDTPASGNRPVVSIDDNAVNNMIRLRTEATDPYFRVVTGGSAQADLDVGTVASNTVYKMAGGFGSNSFLSCINAGTVGSDTSGTVPTVDRLRIGSDQAGAYLNGHIARTSYYSRVLTATEDQGITA